MIPVTVLHNGFIIDEINRVTSRPRYLELAMQLTSWHDLPGHECEDPPEEVHKMLAELKELKLGAFAQAGRRYRMALDAYEKRRDFEAFWASLGAPVKPDTVIDYPPEEPPGTVVDFTYPA